MAVLGRRLPRSDCLVVVAVTLFLSAAAAAADLALHSAGGSKVDLLETSDCFECLDSEDLEPPVAFDDRLCSCWSFTISLCPLP